MSAFAWLSLAVFAFGALSFTVLAWSYWWQKGNTSRLFRGFTITCAAAFVASLASNADFAFRSHFEILREVAVVFLPPMILHLVMERENRIRTVPLMITYALGAASFWFDSLDHLPAASLAFSTFGALAALLLSRRERTRAEQRHRWCNVVILVAMALTAVLDTLSDNLLLDLVPDYLLLLFFAVWLYYRERLAFFDVFLKGGVFFGLGAVQLAVLVATLPATWAATATGLWLWLTGPPVYRWFANAVDRHILGRRYSPIDAERHFLQAIQTSNSRGDLQAKAKAALTDIFQCQPDVDFARIAVPGPNGDLVEGHILLIARENEVPFLSEDRQLLATLAANLGVVLRQQDLAEHATQAELRALRAQINPHFLFNALNAIAGWIRVRPDIADDTVAQLAEVFRYALHRSENEFVRLADELDFIRAYLAVEQARFGDRLQTSITGEPPVFMIPAMIIQPLVENAIKHGTSQLTGPGRIDISVNEGEGIVRIDVMDNGPGFPADIATGHGLRNISHRLLGYYNGRAALRWENVPMGCRVTIEIPSA